MTTDFRFPNSEISTILFDWGGVLIENPVEGICRFAETHIHGISSKGLEYRSVELFQKGEIGEAEFWKMNNAPADLNLDLFEGSLWRKAFEHTYMEKKAVFGLASDLQQKGYLTGMLSNTEMPAVEMLQSFGYTCFDHYFFSCEMHLIKPDPRIYEETIKVLEIPSEKILFIDDKSENIESAIACGMKGHVMRDLGNLQECLRQLALPLIQGI